MNTLHETYKGFKNLMGLFISILHSKINLNKLA